MGAKRQAHTKDWSCLAATSTDSTIRFLFLRCDVVHSPQLRQALTRAFVNLPIKHSNFQGYCRR